MAAYEGGYGHTHGSYAKAVRMRGGTSVTWSIWDKKMAINGVTRAPPGLIFIENTKQDTRNPILRTPRPGDPYLYELCPPEILPTFGNKSWNSDFMGGTHPPQNPDFSENFGGA